MVKIRQEKVDKIAPIIFPNKRWDSGPESGKYPCASLVVLYGAIKSAKIVA